MNALRVLGRIPANPLQPTDGPVCPRKIVAGQQDLSVETLVDCFASLAQVKPEVVFAMDTTKGLVPAFWKFCVALLYAMGPERQEDTPPKQ